MDAVGACAAVRRASPSDHAVALAASGGRCRRLRLRAERRRRSACDRREDASRKSRGADAGQRCFAEPGGAGVGDMPGDDGEARRARGGAAGRRRASRRSSDHAGGRRRPTPRRRPRPSFATSPPPHRRRTAILAPALRHDGRREERCGGSGGRPAERAGQRRAGMWNGGSGARRKVKRGGRSADVGWRRNRLRAGGRRPPVGRRQTGGAAAGRGRRRGMRRGVAGVATRPSATPDFIALHYFRCSGRPGRRKVVVAVPSWPGDTREADGRAPTGRTEESEDLTGLTGMRL